MAEGAAAAAAAGSSTAKHDWWPCSLTPTDLSDLIAEGYIKDSQSPRFVPNEEFPAPKEGERVVTKTLLERGFSFPPSKFFADFLKTFNLQPQHISPNSVTALSGFVTLCEGFLGIEPTDRAANVLLLRQARAVSARRSCSADFRLHSEETGEPHLPVHHSPPVHQTVERYIPVLQGLGGTWRGAGPSAIRGCSGIRE